MTSGPAVPQTCAYFESSKGACLGPVKVHSGENYCPLHHPANDRIAEYRAALNQKLKNGDYNFAWVRFAESVMVEGGEWTTAADFSGATFTEEVLFRNSFSKVSFKSTKFNRYFGATSDFNGEADFTLSEFAETANFVGSNFHQPVSFLGTKFGGETMFDNVTFRASVKFNPTCRDSLSLSGTEGQNAFALNEDVIFEASRFDNPALVQFYNTVLRPWWFCGAPISQVVFTNVTWQNVTGDEIQRAVQVHGQRAHALLGAAYRNLAVNSEDSHRYRQASDFRYSSMEVQRHSKNEGRAFWTLHWWYWAASGYGERIRRATMGLIVLWLLFGLLYMRVGFARTDVQLAPATTAQQVAIVPADTVGQPLRFSKALMYSLGVLSLQKPDQKPVTDAATFLVIAESIVGPLQAALLILAIRRKFMR